MAVLKISDRGVTEVALVGQVLGCPPEQPSRRLTMGSRKGTIVGERVHVRRDCPTPLFSTNGAKQRVLVRFSAFIEANRLKGG